jgi:hypothetical protein
MRKETVMARKEKGSRLNNRTIERKGPENEACYKALQSLSRHLIANASEHFASVLVGLAKLLKGCIALAAGLVVGTRPLRVEIPTIQLSVG